MKLVSFAFCVLLLVSWAKANRLALRAATAVDDAGCQGRLDWSKFAKLNQICDECYSLYKEIDVYRLCRCVFMHFIRFYLKKKKIGFVFIFSLAPKSKFQNLRANLNQNKLVFQI